MKIDDLLYRNYESSWRHIVFLLATLGIGGAMLHLEFIGDSLLMSWIGLLSIVSLAVFAYKSPNEEVATLLSWIVVLYLALTIGYGIVYQLINPQAGYIPFLLLSFGGTVVYSVFTIFVCQIIIFIIPFAKFITSDSGSGGRPVEKDILTEEEYEEFKPHPTMPEFVPPRNYYQNFNSF